MPGAYSAYATGGPVREPPAHGPFREPVLKTARPPDAASHAVCRRARGSAVPSESPWCSVKDGPGSIFLPSGSKSAESDLDFAAVTAYVYAFADGSSDMRDVLGGKGAELAEMTSIGLPVPARVHGHHRGLPCVSRGRRRMARRPVRRGVQAPGRPRGALRREEPRRPRRSASRLGAVGLAGVDARDDGHDPEPRAESAVGRGTGAGVRQRAVRGRLVPPVRADVLERGARRAERPVRGRAHAGEEPRGVHADVDLDASALRELVEEFLSISREQTGRDFPEDPREQLDGAITAVFASWNTPRARTYRRHEDISDDLGTAVNIMQMVYGNLGDDSATGVVFTRNPLQIPTNQVLAGRLPCFGQTTSVPS